MNAESPISRKLPFWLLICVAAGFSVIFTAIGLQIYGVFGATAYDFGIFDQAFWQYSRFLSPFNTVRGLNILGDHFSPIAFVFAPLYFLWPDIFWPLVLQSVSVAAAGVILYSIARHLLPARPWVGFALAVSYYLHPAVHNTLLWQYHEIVLASGLYMALIWSYLKDRPRLFFLLLVLLLACREDMPFTLLPFGVVALLERRWRYGWVAILLSIAWWMLATKVAMPYFNALGYYRISHGVLAGLFSTLTNPGYYLERILDPQSQRYVLQVLVPAGLVGLFSPRYLLPALPTLAANVLIGQYNTLIAYHYSVSIMPFLYWGALMTLQRTENRHLPTFSVMPLLQWTKSLTLRLINSLRLFLERLQLMMRLLRVQQLLAWAMLLTSLWLGCQYSAVEVRQLPDRYRAWLDNSAKRAMLKSLDQQFGGEGVAASDNLLPHLSHRKNIYLFPNPWEIHYWGIAGESPHHPNNVQHIVIPWSEIREHGKLYDYLIESRIFGNVTHAQEVMVLRRLKAEAADRNQAINDYSNFSQMPQPAFTRTTISPAYRTMEKDFGRLDVDLALLQESAPANWEAVPDSKPGAVLKLELGEAGKSDFMTRYVRSELRVAESAMAYLDLGSDDGVTVWVNQRKVHENIVLRGANIEDDRVSFHLRSGANVIAFRVNNATGAWRLQTRIRTQRCREDCLSQLAH